MTKLQKQAEESWISRFNRIETFIEKHNRFPSQSIKEENHEYQFLYQQTSKFKNNRLPEERIIPFKEFLNKHQQHFASKKLRKDWQSRINSILLFVEKHNRLPKYSIKEEKANAKFLHAQKTKFKNNLLSPPKAELLTNFFNKHIYYFFPQSKKQQNKYLSRLNSLSLFIAQHKRLPDPRIKEELSHYRFLHLQKHRLKNNILPQERVCLFKEFYKKHQQYFPK